jgi:hypothetical protein
LAKICCVDECNNIQIAKELCEKHYRRFRRHGNPLGKADKIETSKKISKTLTEKYKIIKNVEKSNQIY